MPIQFGGQIRVRSEADGRDFNHDTNLNTYTLLRMRFGALVQPLEEVDIFIQIQDSRAFGQEPNTLANTFNLDLHQAYVQIKNLWDKPISLKAMRQEMVYGSERLIGAVGWNNVGAPSMASSGDLRQKIMQMPSRGTPSMGSLFT